MKKENLWQVLISPRIWMLSMVYFGVSTTMYGVTLWLPSVIQSLSRLSYFVTGIVSALPFVVTAVVMVLVGMLSDRTGERRWHTAIPAFAGAVAVIGAGYGSSTVVVVACIALGMAFAEAMVGPFLGDGNFAHGRPFGSRRHRSHQFAGQSGRIFRSRHYWILSQAEWRISRRTAGDRRDSGPERHNRIDRGPSGPARAGEVEPHPFDCSGQARLAAESASMGRLAIEPTKSCKNCHFHFAQSAQLFTIVASPDYHYRKPLERHTAIWNRQTTTPVRPPPSTGG